MAGVLPFDPGLVPYKAPNGQPAQNFQQAMNGVTLGKPDANGNIWQYKTVSSPNPKGVPYKPVQTTYLVNQHGQHFRDWFQQNFGIDTNGQPVNPLHLSTFYSPPSKAEVAAATPHKAAPAQTTAAHVTTNPAAAIANQTTKIPSLGNIKIDPKVAASIQAALAGTSVNALSRGVNVPQIPVVNAQQFAKNATALQFNPLIQAIHGQETATQGALPTMLSNLNKWYGAVDQQAQQSAQSNAAAYQNAASSNTNDVQRIMSSLTGGDSGAGYALGQQGANAAQAINTQGANQASIDNALRTNIANNLAGQKSSAQNSINTALQALRTQELQTRSDEAQTAGQNYLQGLSQRSGAISQNLQNKSVAQNMRLAAALAGPQIAGAKLANLQTGNNILTNQSNTALNQALAKQKAAEGAATTTSGLKNDALQRYMVTHPGASQKTFQQDMTDPNYGTALQSYVWGGNLLGQKVDAAGNVHKYLQVNPNRAYQLILGKLKTSAPVGTNPAILQQWAANQVLNVIPGSPFQSTDPNRPWKFANGKFSK